MLRACVTNHGSLFWTQDAISESLHSLLRLFIFNVNVSHSEIVDRHISGSQGKCVSPGPMSGSGSGSEQGCKAVAAHSDVGEISSVVHMVISSDSRTLMQC